MGTLATPLIGPECCLLSVRWIRQGCKGRNEVTPHLETLTVLRAHPAWLPGPAPVKLPSASRTHCPSHPSAVSPHVQRLLLQ